MRRSRIVVSGTVQGVFFRDSCRRTAREHGVCGWVRNLPDGRVEAVFEGTEEDVARLVTWARRGPAAAVVEEVAVHPEEPEGLTGFDVRPAPRT
ncbi:acylphosphatase [Streptomyces sodiiphilus]|uniref:Acylphosphatase n=1 Tax=Streptomyces sodiiphilus TaxID=226217 RepID=A0ABN2P587_9ACTN